MPATGKIALDTSVVVAVLRRVACPSPLATPILLPLET